MPGREQAATGEWSESAPISRTGPTWCREIGPRIEEVRGIQLGSGELAPLHRPRRRESDAPQVMSAVGRPPHRRPWTGQGF